MFDIAPTEFLLVAFVALVVIGPKDLPKAMRILGYWVGRARAIGRQFRSGFDEMVREAELAEMEKKWKAENERIMREFSSSDHTPALPDATGAEGSVDEEPAPVMVERPHVVPAEHGSGQHDPDQRDADQPSLFAEPEHSAAATPPAADPMTDGKAPS